MKLFERRFGRIVTRRWSDDEQAGINIAVTLPKAADVRYRWDQTLYRALRRNPQVKVNEMLAMAHGQRVELLQRELEEIGPAALQAIEDAQAMYDHTQEVVDIIGMYQRSLKTLWAADPHEARVKAVVENFFEQYEDRYGRDRG